MLTEPPYAPPTAAAASELPDDDVPSERSQAVEAGADVDVLIERLYEPPMLPTHPGYATWLAATAADALRADPTRFHEVAAALLRPEHAQLSPAHLHHACAAAARYAAAAIDTAIRANKLAFVPRAGYAWDKDMPTWYTDDYDNSVEVFHADLVGARATALAAAMRALGFSRVWVHPHAGDRAACATVDCGGPL